MDVGQPAPIIRRYFRARRRPSILPDRKLRVTMKIVAYLDDAGFTAAIVARAPRGTPCMVPLLPAPPRAARSPCENDGGGTIMCGEYHDGPSNGWCLEECSDVCTTETACNRACLQTGDPFDCETYAQGICDNTCETICNSATSTGEEFCLGNGGAGTTCANYGKFARCNDGVCAPGEVCVCSECSLYCLNDDINLLTANLPSEPTYNESDLLESCEAANLFWTSDWMCPDLSQLTSNGTCAENEIWLTHMQNYAQQTDRMASEIREQFDCETYPNQPECSLAQDLQNISDQIWSDYLALNSIPCYL